MLNTARNSFCHEFDECKTVTKILFITLNGDNENTKKSGRYEIDFSIGHASTLMPMQLISHKYPIEFFNSFRKQFKYKVEVTKASNV